MAFRFDPETLRQPVAGPDGLTMIAVGARRGSYEAARTLLMIVRLVLWNLADSLTNIGELRRYLRDESVEQFERRSGPALQGVDLG